jgi:AT-rich DNA-binding protein
LPNLKDNKRDEVSNAVVNRLPKYYRCLREFLNNDKLRVSSKELAAAMNTTASQIRQDLNSFGGFGQQGYGYNVKTLYTNISAILGINDTYSAVILGMGRLGMILADEAVFSKRGVILRAAFDGSGENIGREILPDIFVRDISGLEEYCTASPIDIVVMTDYPEYTELLNRCGIKGIWNFTGRTLDNIDKNISVEDIFLGDTLMMLCYKMNMKQKDQS